MIGERPDHYFYQFLTNMQEFRFFAVIVIVITVIFQISVMIKKYKLREYLWYHIMVFILLSYFWNSAYKLDMNYRPFLEFYKDGLCYYDDSYQNHYLQWNSVEDITISKGKSKTFITFLVKSRNDNNKSFRYSIISGWDMGEIKLIALMRDYIAKAKENPPAPDAQERRCTTLPEKP